MSLCEGVQPPVGPFVMTVAFEVLEDPENPPNEIRELPLPGVLPPCATACETGGPVSKPSLIVKKLDTPPGDDTLTFKGELVVPHPFAPTLDPVANGIAVVIEDCRRHSRARRHGAGRRVRSRDQGGLGSGAQRDELEVRRQERDAARRHHHADHQGHVEEAARPAQGEGDREARVLSRRHGEPSAHRPPHPRPADGGVGAVWRGDVRRAGAELHDGRQGREVQVSRRAIIDALFLDAGGGWAFARTLPSAAAGQRTQIG